MTIESDTDRLLMIDADDFAESATIGIATVLGIFDDGLEAPSDPRTPRFLCRTSDVSSSDHGDTVTIGGTNYIIQGFRPDGQGMTELVLRK